MSELVTDAVSAYKVGKVSFMGVELEAAPGALVPRAETELLGKTALEILRARGAAPTFIDMCCGSGNLALAIATAGSSAALGLPSGAGRLVAGAPADVVVLDARAAAFVPPNDLISQLVLRANDSAVRHVFVAGEIRVRDGVLLGMDWDEVAEAASRLAAARAGSTEPRDPLAEQVERMLRRLRGAEPAA